MQLVSSKSLRIFKIVQYDFKMPTNRTKELVLDSEAISYFLVDINLVVTFTGLLHQ